MERIKNEIEQTDFVAPIIDKTSDNMHKSQLSTVFHYIDKNNEVQERINGITDMSEDNHHHNRNNHQLFITPKAL